VLSVSAAPMGVMASQRYPKLLLGMWTTVCAWQVGSLEVFAVMCFLPVSTVQGLQVADSCIFVGTWWLSASDSTLQSCHTMWSLWYICGLAWHNCINQVVNQSAPLLPALLPPPLSWPLFTGLLHPPPPRGASTQVTASMERAVSCTACQPYKPGILLPFTLKISRSHNIMLKFNTQHCACLLTSTHTHTGHGFNGEGCEVCPQGTWSRGFSRAPCKPCPPPPPPPLPLKSTSLKQHKS
jgi:hypothetical protein